MNSIKELEFVESSNEEYTLRMVLDSWFELYIKIPENICDIIFNKGTVGLNFAFGGHYI